MFLKETLISDIFTIQAGETTATKRAHTCTKEIKDAAPLDGNPWPGSGALHSPERSSSLLRSRTEVLCLAPVVGKAAGMDPAIVSSFPALSDIPFQVSSKHPLAEMQWHYTEY